MERQLVKERESESRGIVGMKTAHVEISNQGIQVAVDDAYNIYILVIISALHARGGTRCMTHKGNPMLSSPSYPACVICCCCWCHCERKNSMFSSFRYLFMYIITLTHLTLFHCLHDRMFKRVITALHGTNIQLTCSRNLWLKSNGSTIVIAC